MSAMLSVRGIGVAERVRTSTFVFKLFSFSFFDGYSILRTFPQTRAKAVTEFFINQARLSIYYPDRPLGTGGNTNPTPIALFLINMDYFSDCHR